MNAVRLQKQLEMDGASAASASKETGTGSSDTASTSYQQYPEMSAEQEFFLYELETTDSGSVGLVLRAIYDCGDVHKFARALEHRIHHYDKSIQRICSYHYQGYIDSMKQLLQLKTRSLEIKAIEDVNAVDRTIQESSNEIRKRSAEIVRYQKLQRNANTAIDHISLCLPVLENYAKLNELMLHKKYYQALKVLEELEHTYMVHVDNYRFTQALKKSLFPIREQIKEKSFSEFTDFLENIRKVSGRIGQHASKCTAEQHSLSILIHVSLSTTTLFAILQLKKNFYRYYQALKVLEELEHTYMVHVDNYRFTQALKKSLFPIREQIKEKSFSEFTDFLENIRKVSGRIGQHASKCTAEQHSFGMTEAERTKRMQEEARKNALNGDVELSSDGSIIKKTDDKTQRKIVQMPILDEDELLSAQDLIDFTPIHRCCQIFNVIVRNFLKVFYTDVMQKRILSRGCLCVFVSVCSSVPIFHLETCKS
ncbi:unnamed protein product [Gongylonema pulchrum]|uniref:Exocyst complex component EXOC6/Sec15 N-terminal domain-containing protein n=1 Tax=Gongylonema pulchrum TaxID=637853 RepID=A0A3P7NHK9_9BILA|nr:unnamed protein product [Gongylonema pulchrum]